MNITKKIKEFFIGAGILALAYSAPNFVNAQNSAEVRTNKENTTLDVKVDHDITSKINLFLRGITTTKYENEYDHVESFDLSYKLGDNICGVLEIQGNKNDGLIPRLGPSYLFKRDNLSAYFLGTVGVTDGKADVEIFTNIAYEKPLKQDLNLILRLENTTNMRGYGHNFSVQRVGAGIKFKRFEYGIFLDDKEAGRKTEFRAGIYARITF